MSAHPAAGTEEKSSVEEHLAAIESHLEVVATVLRLQITDPKWWEGDGASLDLARTHTRHVLLTLLPALKECLPFPLSEYRGEPISAWLVRRSGDRQ